MLLDYTEFEENTRNYLVRKKVPKLFNELEGSGVVNVFCLSLDFPVLQHTT